MPNVVVVKIIATTDYIHFYYIQISNSFSETGYEEKTDDRWPDREMIESETVTQKTDSYMHPYDTDGW